MAWGRIYKRGKNYYTDTIFQGQRKREKVGTQKDVAKKILDKKLSEMTLEEHGIIEEEKVTLEEFAKEYLIQKKNSTRPCSYSRIEIAINVHLAPYFGKEFLFNVTPHKVFSYQSKRLSEGVCNATVNREVGCLNNLLNTAVTWKRIKSNPIKKIPRLKEPPGRVRYLELPEINRLLASCPDPPHPLRAIVTVALTTGMRKAEIFWLKWEYIRSERRCILLPNSKNNMVRFIPANDTLLRTLEGLPRVSEYVFLGRKNKPFVDLKISFKDACTKAGIEGFRFHDLRHTYASHLAMRGVHLRALQELLGHKTIQMTQRYSHLSPEHLQGAVKLLDDIIPPAADAQGEEKAEGLGTILTPDRESGKKAAENPLRLLQNVSSGAQ
jgi:integrase